MSARTRYLLLSLVALGLFAALLWRREFSGDERAAPAAAGAARPDLAAQIVTLRRLAATEEPINKAYAEQGFAYAQAMVTMETLKAKDETNRAFIDRVIKRKLGDLPGDLALTVGEAQKLAEGVARVPVEISFTARSDRQATAALIALGLPETGFSWDEFSLLSDPRARKVTLTGRLSALVMEPVE